MSTEYAWLLQIVADRRLGQGVSPGLMNFIAFRAMSMACFIMAVEWEGSGNSGSTARRHFGKGLCELDPERLKC
jgi:hypothetical protein